MIVVRSPAGQGVRVAREGNGRRARRNRGGRATQDVSRLPARRATAGQEEPNHGASHITHRGRASPCAQPLRHRRCGTNPSEPPVDDAHRQTPVGSPPGDEHLGTFTGGQPQLPGTHEHVTAAVEHDETTLVVGRCQGERSRRVGQGQRGPVQREHDRSGHPSLCRGERRNTRGTQPHHGLLAAHLRPEFDRLGQTGRRRSRPRTTPATSSRDAPPSVPTSSATRSPSGLTFTAWTASPAEPVGADLTRRSRGWEPRPD